MSDQTCPGTHKHGETGTCYVIHKCRCRECRAGQAARERQRSKLHAYGRYVSPNVPAGPVREHVLFLRSKGMGYKTIAQRAGVSVTGVRALIYGREDYVDGGHGPRHGEQLQHVGRDKAAKLLAVQPTLDNLPQVAHVPARGSVRRIRALIALGWSQTAVADALGVDPSNLGIILRRYAAAEVRGKASRVLVRASTARAAVTVYERLSAAAPPCSTKHERITYARSVRYAKERGWALPMDWEAFDNAFDRAAPVTRSAA